MTVWKKCRMATYWPDETDVGCEVSILGAGITVSYRGEAGLVTYKGSEVEPGHYELQCAENGGRATLHRCGDGEWLEGFWTEEGNEGMWRLELSE